MRNITICTILATAALLTSCKLQRLLKDDDWRVKYDAAIEYYNQGDYHRSMMLFEDILPYTRGVEEGEEIHYLYAYCCFYQSNFLLSAYYFREFYTIFGRSKYVPEAYYMEAYSLYLTSPRYNLDATTSKEAIAALGNYISKFPKDKYVKTAKEFITTLENDLAKKDYEIAKLYLKLHYSKAAIIAIENFQRDFPFFNNYNEELSFLKIKASFEYAQRSKRKKQKERFENCLDSYLYYIDYYPDGNWTKEAEGIYELCLDKLEKLKLEKQQNTQINN